MYINKLINLASDADVLPSETIGADPFIGIFFIVLGLLFVLLAFFAFKFMRLSNCILGASLGLSLGMNQLALFIGDAVPQPVVILLSLALATLGVFIALKLFKLSVYIYTGIFILTFTESLFTGIFTQIFGDTFSAYYIATLIGVVITVLAACRFSKHFKQMFIVFTSYAYMVLGGLFIQLGLLDCGIYFDNMYLIITVASMLLSFLPMYVQFKTTQDIDFD